MKSTETVMTAVAQALFQVTADGSVSVVACSLDAEGAWLKLARPRLSFVKTIDVSSAGDPNRGTAGEFFFPLPNRRSSARLP
jgi:hypothetical protein